MTPTRFETVDGDPVITVTQPRLFGWLKPKIRKFIGKDEGMACYGYWRWFELPGKQITGDELLFKLSAWNRAFNIGSRNDDESRIESPIPAGNYETNQ